MWNVLIIINSVFLTVATTFLVYAVGAAIILGEWKQLLIAFLVFVFLGIVEVVLAALNM